LTHRAFWTKLSHSGLTNLFRALIISGFPAASMISTYTGVSISIPYRIFVFVIAFLVLYITLARARRVTIDIWLVFFFVAYLVRMLYDWLRVDIDGADFHLLFFTVTVLIPVLASVAAGPVEEAVLGNWLFRISLFTISLAVLALLFDLDFNPWGDAGDDANLSRLQFEKLNPISLAHAAGVYLIYAAYRSLTYRPKILEFAILLSGCILAFYTMVLANSRGPILAFGAAIGFLLLSRREKAAKFAFFTLVLSPLLIFAAPLLLDFIGEGLEKLWTRFTLDNDQSTLDRFFIQARAVESFTNNPIFGAHYRDPQLNTNQYPHNLLIETAMALGIVGLIPFVFLNFRAFMRIISKHGRRFPLTSALFIQQFIGTSLSGSLWSADSFFLIMSMVLTWRIQPASKNQAMRVSRTPSRVPLRLL
jgi:O-antigen ligase